MELLHSAERYSYLVSEARRIHDERQVRLMGKWRTQRRRLRKALRNSDGKAVVVVHPFYPEETSQVRTENEAFYNQYKEGLLSELMVYCAQGLPVIFFEEQSSRGAILKKMEQLTLPVKNTFVVPTVPHSPQPRSMPLDAFSKRLSRYGITEAVVVGSNLFHSSPHFLPVVPEACVGIVFLNLKDAGIKTAFGESTFPEKGRN